MMKEKNINNQVPLLLAAIIPLAVVLVMVFFAAKSASTAKEAPILIEVKGASTKNDVAPDAGYSVVTISHTVRERETLATVARKYHADSQTIADYPYNEIDDTFELTPGQVLIIPNGSIDSPVLPPTAIASSGTLIWPTTGEISQYAYWWHTGAIDIAAPLSTPVRAAGGGKVVKVERLLNGYGHYVVINHDNGLTSLYAHLSRINVEEDQNVSKGYILGAVGATGRATGPHLHFETQENGQPVDPMSLLN